MPFGEEGPTGFFSFFFFLLYNIHIYIYYIYYISHQKGGRSGFWWTLAGLPEKNIVIVSLSCIWISSRKHWQVLREYHHPSACEWSPDFREQCPRLWEQGALIVILPCFSSDLEQRAKVKHPRSVMDLHTASLAAGRWSGYLAIFESLQPQSMRHVHQGRKGKAGEDKADGKTHTFTQQIYTQ